MAQPALFVQRLVGVGHINALLQQALNQVAGRLPVSGVLEGLVRRLVPDVDAGAAVPGHKGLALHLIVSQHTERRDDVLFEVLILVIAPDKDKVGLEGVNFFAQFAEAVDQPLPRFLRGCQSFILAILDTHGFRPVGGNLQFRRELRVAQAAGDGKVHFLVGFD